MRKLACLTFILLLIACDAATPFDPVLPKHTKDSAIVGTGKAGETFYNEEDVTRHSVNFYSTVSISYVYLGIENNSVKLKRIDYSSDSTGNNREKNNIILLPLDENKQAILEVSPHTRRLRAVKLIITVTDNSDRIKVKEEER
jgi:hypothetical protein